MKKSFGDCNSCPLIDQKLVVGETNCQDNINKVRVLIIAEAPAYDESVNGRPLIGKAGKIFRQAFSESNLCTIPYFITNTVLCTNLTYDNNGKAKTHNPPPEAIKACADNLDKLIDATEPELIFAMGNVPLGRFGISEDGGITKYRGQIYKYRNIDIMFTFHPSSLGHRGGINSDSGALFIDDFKMAHGILTNTSTNNYDSWNTSSVYSYKFEDWMMNEDYTLIDMQRLTQSREVLFTFRNVNTNQRKYYRKKDADYYFYINENYEMKNAPFVAPASDMKVCLTKPNKEKFYAHYESDIRTEVKNSIDYYYQRTKLNKEEKSLPLKKMFFDLEVYSAGDRSFPDPKKAERPINAVSFKLGAGPIHIWLANIDGIDKSYDINNVPKFIPIKSDKKGVITETQIPADIRLFDSEYDLLTAFCDKLKTEDIDIMSGWNSWGFDCPTLFGRMIYNNIDLNYISPVEST